jgi:integrase
MSVYSVKNKGWRYDFTLKGNRYTECWFPTKREALRAEAQKREELSNPPQLVETLKPAATQDVAEAGKVVTQTDMTFLEMVNLRLDHVKAYNSPRHYQEHFYMAKRWVKEWGNLPANAITRNMVERFVIQRKMVSAHVANKEIRYLRSTFNFALKNEIIAKNPANGLDFFPEDKSLRYVPTPDDLDKVIEQADEDTRDYLWALRDTMARVGEINALKWDDVDLENQFVVLYTRKKKGGHRTPRKIPMTNRLHNILSRRYEKRNNELPWIFWHEYPDRKTGQIKKGPYQDRKRLMKGLCEKAGVRYFRFHAFRHSGASVMERERVSIGSIQRLLGHENRLTTEIYLHSLDQSERDAISIFEAAGKKSHTESHTEQKRSYGSSP